MNIKSLPSGSRNILESRPNIQFVEPPVIQTPIVAKVPSTLPEVQKVIALANNVNVLAKAIQTKIDLRAGDMIVKLDPRVDAQAIAAMRRQYPDLDPTQITYDQYKTCKDRMMNAGIGLANNILDPPTYPDSLRPELDQNIQIVQPLDIDELQNFLIYTLWNYIWKMFLRPILTGIPMTGGLFPKDAPGKPKGYNKMKNRILGAGAPMLGEKKKKTQTPATPKASEVLK